MRIRRKPAGWVLASVLLLAPIATVAASHNSEPPPADDVPASVLPTTGESPGNPTVGPAASGTDWRLVFADEFDGTALDATKWHTCHWWAPETCTIETHNELSLYTKDNVEVDDGVLTLRARREQAVGWNGKTFPYTSGMVSSGGSPYSTPEKPPGFEFRYGYVEARIKVPAGQGLCPAFWLPMADHTWPPEIDVLEILGQRPKRALMHYHYRRANGTHANVGGGWNGPDFSAGWHTFGVHWAPGELTWYIDGVKRYRVKQSNVTDKPAYLVLNLAVGGNWPGSPDENTAFPADLLVDWVRVHQRPADVGSGAAG